MDTVNAQQAEGTRRGVTDILYLEPTRDYSRFIKELTDGQFRNHRIFLPSPGHIKIMVDQARAMGINLEPRFIPYTTINMAYDNEMYETAFAMAETSAAIIQSLSNRFFGNREAVLPDRLRWAYAVTMHDRLVAQIRQFFEFRFSMNQIGFARVVFAPRPHAAWRFTFDIIAYTPGVKSTNVWSEHWSRGQLQSFSSSEPAPKSFLPKQITTLGGFNPVRKNKVGVIFCTNQSDKQYRLSGLPLLGSIARRERIALINALPFPEDFTLSNFPEVAEHKASGRITIVDKEISPGRRELKEQELEFLMSLARRLSKSLIAKGNMFSELHGIISVFMMTSVLSVLDYIQNIESSLSEIIGGAHCVVLLPGRTVEACVVASYANYKGVPTVEIQSGTLARIRKYVTPIATEFFAIEAFSKDVLCSFLGKNDRSVIVTGGPKLEFDVAPFRKLDREEARRRYPELEPHRGKQWLLHAGQPLGVTMSGAIVEILMLAVQASPNTHLILKPHPSEGPDYLNLYLEKASKLGFTNFTILREARILEAVVAADVVTTYFSTVGLEAFTLKRPVIVVNPFEKRPPFDLVELGVAAEARTPDDLRQFLATLATTGDLGLKYDPTLETLRDGKTITRVQNLILERARRHRDRNNPVHPAYYARKARSLARRLGIR